MKTTNQTAMSVEEYRERALFVERYLRPLACAANLGVDDVLLSQSGNIVHVEFASGQNLKVNVEGDGLGALVIDVMSKAIHF
ncbi:MAG: hypothetical protein LBU47_01880 [Christensenellaceae bacterium]|nr:hypothetical protein [Christensenellaceae bacterium]